MPGVKKRLYGPAQPGTTAATIFTVPTFGTVTITHVRVANGTAAAATFNLAIGTDAAGTRVYDTFSVPAHGIHDAPTGMVIEAGEHLEASQVTSGALTLTISGELNQ